MFKKLYSARKRIKELYSELSLIIVVDIKINRLLSANIAGKKIEKC